MAAEFPNELAVERAWKLAREHNHHWALPRSALPAAAEWRRRRAAISEAWGAPAPGAACGNGNWSDRAAPMPETFGPGWSVGAIEYGPGAEPAPESLGDGPPLTAQEADLLGECPTSVCGGICYPRPEPGLVVTHMTTTGRLDWEIHPDGHAFLSVWRRGAESGGSEGQRAVATAEVRPDGSILFETLEPILDRHLLALVEAVRCITQTEGA